MLRCSRGLLMSWLTTHDWWNFSRSMGRAFARPHSRALGDGLFELRPHGRAGIGRAFYCFLLGKKVVVLHAFIKKSQQTPDNELKLTRKRLKDVKHG